jgi:heme/copper-type cytochrome/quinol oxidase subunit 2
VRIFLGLLLIWIIAFILPIPTGTGQASERVFRVEASSFEYSPAELRVNQGDRVTIELLAMDVVHGLYLDGYDLNITADPGQTARLSFIADRPGTLRFRCSVTCGGLHPFMIGKIHVGQNWLFLKAIIASVFLASSGLWLLRR